MERSTSPGNSFGDRGAREGRQDAVPPVGGADAVQKTTGVTGRGTDPDAVTRPDERDRGETPSGTPLDDQGREGSG